MVMCDDNQIDYGNLTKKVVFTENDHRHAKLIVKLRYDGMTQSAFFRYLITGYIQEDDRIISYIDEVKRQAKNKKSKSARMRQNGKQLLSDMALNDGDIENIFDLILEEHPEL
jgi:hypothetical protein